MSALCCDISLTLAFLNCLSDLSPTNVSRSPLPTYINLINLRHLGYWEHMDVQRCTKLLTLARRSNAIGTTNLAFQPLRSWKIMVHEKRLYMPPRADDIEEFQWHENHSAKKNWNLPVLPVLRPTRPIYSPTTLLWLCQRKNRARICKRLRSPGIDSRNRFRQPV